MIGMGVSNTPLIRMLLRADLDVTVCDRAQRERVEEQAEELESLGARLRLGEAYLEGLDQDVIFRTPACTPATPPWRRPGPGGGGHLGDGAVLPPVPLPPDRCDGQRRQDHHHHHPCGVPERGGIQRLCGGQYRQAPAARCVRHGAGGLCGAGAVLLPADDHGAEPPHRRNDQSVPNHLDYHRSMGEYIAAKENIFLHQGRGPGHLQL